MSKRLTTGPFFIPPVIPQGNIPTNMLITLTNPTNKPRKVTVYLAASPQAIFPTTSTIVPTLTQSVTLDPNTTTQINPTLNVHYQLNDTVRVTITGDIDEEGKKVEATVLVGDSGRVEPTTFFRHADLIETDNKF